METNPVGTDLVETDSVGTDPVGYCVGFMKNSTQKTTQVVLEGHDTENRSKDSGAEWGMCIYEAQWRHVLFLAVDMYGANPNPWCTT